MLNRSEYILTVLKPGSELDGMAAERVMGWKHLGNLANYLPAYGIVWAYGASWSSKCPDDDNIYRLTESGTEPWRPSTNVTDAFQVAEVLRKRSFYLVLFNTFGQYRAAFYPEKTASAYPGQFWQDPHPKYCVWAETASEAICKAALLTTLETDE